MNSPPRPVRTRFAPSPTGYMHIGGMRTALFNWLWARHNQGTFILRIDDTDEERNLDSALGPIQRAFKWLGLTWDEGPEVDGPYAPYFQSQRKHLYRAAVERLLAEGKAYYCFDTPDEIKAEREAAEREKRTYLNSRRSLDLSESERNQRLAEGKPHVIRFLTPRDQVVKLDDVVRGHIEWDCALMPDPVIMRGNGSPLYNFATTIDDAQMQISHVIRAEEHLSNTPVQILLHQALGNELPIFAHIPYVAAPGSKEKLSKRKIQQYFKNPQFKKMFDRANEILPKLDVPVIDEYSPVMVEYYIQMGYLPQGVLNALARIGWSLDDKTEFMSLAEIVKNFTLDRIVKSPASLDPDKLNNFQAHWMAQEPVEHKVDMCLFFLLNAGYITFHGTESTINQTLKQCEQTHEELLNNVLTHSDDEYRRNLILSIAIKEDLLDCRPTYLEISKIVNALGERLKLFSDILDYDEFFVEDDQIKYDEKAFDKYLKAPGAAELVREFADEMEKVEPFHFKDLDDLLHKFVAEKQIKMGDVIHALRVAVTGKSVGMGMFQLLWILGRERCIKRIQYSLARLKTMTGDEG